MYILGISAYYHDSAACLIQDETIVAAAQEERFSRTKNDPKFPASAIAYCLKEAQIKLSDVDFIAFYEKPFLKFERLLETYLSFAPKGLISFLKSMPLWIKDKLFQKKAIIEQLKLIDSLWEYNEENLLFSEHHHSHAASAFYPSPFNEAIILTMDGVGEWETTSIAKGSGNQIDFLKGARFPHSIGLLYSAFTFYLGFKVNSDEYKVMGLAPYGKPVFAETICKHLIDVKDDGSSRLNMDYFGFGDSLKMTNQKFHKLFGSPPRKKGSELTSFHMNLASSIQKVTEEIILKSVNHLHKTYGGNNLCLAGGVALNCVANGRILRESPFENLWIQPAAGDAGGALGAAFAVYYNHLNQPRRCIGTDDKMKNALLGPSFQKDEIKKMLDEKKLRYDELDNTDYYNSISKEITNGKVIGWFHGRMEFGPRALGARSILGDARNPEMQSTMNLKIKYRESFRPFAPVILEECVNEYYDMKVSSPYMLLVDYLKSEHRVPQSEAHNGTISEQLKQNRSTVPSVTHVDFTSRIQTVNPENNTAFHLLLKSFNQLTGCPMIINTSFNRMDEPIVCSPEDALECFFNTGIDVLAIENLIIRKDSCQTETQI
jgi:carbamoyltransferase